MLFRPTLSYFDRTPNSGKHQFRDVFLTEGPEQKAAPLPGRDLGHSGIVPPSLVIDMSYRLFVFVLSAYH